MKKIILINSPIYEITLQNQSSEKYLPPLGLSYIATFLKNAGFDVSIYDTVKMYATRDEILSFIAHKKPDYLGINIFTQNFYIVKYILENIPITCEIFIGGNIMGSIFEEVLLWNVHNKLNIIIGEGEIIIPKIILKECDEKPLKSIEKKFVYKVNKNSKYFPKDISSVVIDRSFIQNETMINHYNHQEISIVTSRGCPYNCAFCGAAKSLQKNIPIRKRSEESIIKEIENIIKLYPNTQSIRILDDLFLSNKNSIIMSRRIFKKFPKLYWRAMAHIMSLKQNIDEIKTIKESNCKELFIGIESGSHKIRKKINKKGTKNDIVEVISKVLSYDIDVKCYFIYGFPTETKDDFEKTYNLATKLKEISQNQKGNFRTSVFQFRPYHGTLLYNQILKKQGFVYPIKRNNTINILDNRRQFNFESGNYSEESDDLLNKYIINTQKIMEL